MLHVYVINALSALNNSSFCDIFFLLFQYIITIIFALVVGAVYWQLDTDQNGYQNRLILYCVIECVISVAFYCFGLVCCPCRVGAIFFIVLNQVFGNLSAVDLFVQQKALFMLVYKRYHMESG